MAHACTLGLKCGFNFSSVEKGKALIYIFRYSVHKKRKVKTFKIVLRFKEKKRKEIVAQKNDELFIITGNCNITY